MTGHWRFLYSSLVGALHEKPLHSTEFQFSPDSRKQKQFVTIREIRGKKVSYEDCSRCRREAEFYEGGAGDGGIGGTEWY